MKDRILQAYQKEICYRGRFSIMFFGYNVALTFRETFLSIY